MTHSYIQDNEIRDRYVTGRLSEEEQSFFEEHLSDCSECLGEVEMLQRFHRGLRTAAAEDVLHGIALQTGVQAWFMRRSRSWRTVLVIGLVFFVCAPATLVYFTTQRSAQKRVNQIQAALADLRREYSDQQKTTDKLRDDLQTLREATHITGPDQPSASLPLFTLDQVRDPDLGNPATEVSIPSYASSVILVLEFEPDPGAGDYRSKIFNEHNQLIWSANNLKLSRRDAIAVILRSDLLKRGNYTFKLESCDKNHHCYPVATYFFRATLPT